MKKTVIINAIVLLLSLTATAQDKKVAVFDPARSIDNTVREIVREEISSVIVNAGGYTVLERSLINKVLEENKFQTGGLVDDSQVSDIGKRLGANLAFVSSITIMSNESYYISCKMIDVLTARIDKQKTALTTQGADDLINVVQNLVNGMFGLETSPSQSSQSYPSSSQSTTFATSSGGKEITYTCEKFPAFGNSAIEGVVEVFLDGECIWKGGCEGFVIKVKDPKPGIRTLQVSVKAFVKEGRKFKVMFGNNLKSGEEVPVLGNSGGTFTVNTLEKDYFQLETNKWNFSVKMKK